LAAGGPSAPQSHDLSPARSSGLTLPRRRAMLGPTGTQEKGGQAMSGYTRGVLTVIAACLVWLCVRGAARPTAWSRGRSSW